MYCMVNSMFKALLGMRSRLIRILIDKMLCCKPKVSF
jgi:hypothetical protein